MDPRKIPPKKVKKKDITNKTHLFLRDVSKTSKTKFKNKAASLGYNCREYFELVVKGL